MKHFIITGHSKGLGAGITSSLIAPGHHIHGISRTDSQQLKNDSLSKGGQYSFHPYDLSETDRIDQLVSMVFDHFEEDNVEGLYLINNAGVIEPIGPMEALAAGEVKKHIDINLVAPYILINEFIKQSKKYKTEKRVLNISSGAASNPYPGWSAYCAGKAGLEMVTRCAANEQKEVDYPVKVISVAPGIIDTDMQTTIRSTSEEQFVLRQKFVELKEKGLLVKPEVAGKKLAEIIQANVFENGLITDIRDQY